MRTHALTHSRRTVRSSVLLLKEKPFEAYVIVFDKIVSNYPQISNYEIYWVVFARTLEFEPYIYIYIYIREITMHAFARVLFGCLFFIRLCFFLQALFYPFCLNVRISWTKPSVFACLSHIDISKHWDAHKHNKITWKETSAYKKQQRTAPIKSHLIYIQIIYWLNKSTLFNRWLGEKTAAASPPFFNTFLLYFKWWFFCL